MKTVDVALHRLAARQYSLAHRTQALELGMSRRQLQSRVAAGLLLPVHRGVYRLAGAPASPEQAVLAACPAGGRVASHRSAAVMWGLRAVESTAPEITVRGTACPPSAR